MLLQSLLGIVYSDDWLAFIREVYVTHSFSPFFTNYSLSFPLHPTATLPQTQHAHDDLYLPPTWQVD
jgi:hypothetical protein